MHTINNHNRPTVTFITHFKSRRSVESLLVVVVWTIFVRNQLDDSVWRFLLTGGVALENPHANPAPEWMTDRSWSEIVRASNLPNLSGFMKSEYIFNCPT